jgi:hypothetical protein
MVRARATESATTDRTREDGLPDVGLTGQAHRRNDGHRDSQCERAAMLFFEWQDEVLCLTTEPQAVPEPVEGCRVGPCDGVESGIEQR